MKYMKLKIYLDSGANINPLKKHFKDIDFYQFPYDSAHRNKKLIERGIIKLAKPSDMQWRDAHQTWHESSFTYEDCGPSDKFCYFQSILETSSKKPKDLLRRDILHLDSAYKTGCHIFITSDYRDIAKNKEKLEQVGGFKIFRSDKEASELESHLKTYLNQFDT